MRLSELLGFRLALAIGAVSDLEPEKAREALIQAAGQQLGSGLRAGTFVVKSRDNHLLIALRTLQGRSWYAPLLECTLRATASGGTLLRGQFRLTYLQMLGLLMFQLGVVYLGAIWIATGKFRDLGLSLTAAIACTAAAVLTAVYIPRLAFKTRRSKIDQIITWLRKTGFAIQSPTSSIQGVKKDTFLTDSMNGG